MMRHHRNLVAAAALLLAGCSTSPERPKPARGPSGPIQEIHLFGNPVALNIDAIPGPDAVGVRVYASNRRTARGLRIKSGALEVLMFPAPLPEPGEAPPIALKTWRFTPTELRPNESESTIGIGYRLALPFGADVPPVAGVTLIARYIDPSGAVVDSSPSTISLLIK